MRYLLALLALVALACAPPKSPSGMRIRQMPLVLSMSDELPLLQQALAFSAWDDWRITSGGAVQVVEDPSGDVSIVPDERVAFGMYVDDRLIRVNPTLPDDVFRSVMLHELGHAFGLPQLPVGIMAGYPEGFINCIDETALRTLCSAYHCTQPKATCR